MNKATEWRTEQQIKAQQEEHEAFQAIVKLVPRDLQDEAIKLWVKGTEASANEAYNRRLMMSELNDQDFKATQEIVHNAWRELMGL
jgi:ribosome recycling factor